MQAEARVATGRPKPAGGFELFAWFFMRLSGLALFILAIGHLAIMHLINSIDSINYAFVAARYTTPFWRSYDMLMLILALLHGCNGLRTVIEDYCHKPALRLVLLSLLCTALLVFLIIGCMIIVTFQPGSFAK